MPLNFLILKKMFFFNPLTIQIIPDITKCSQTKSPRANPKIHLPIHPSIERIIIIYTFHCFYNFVLLPVLASATDNAPVKRAYKQFFASHLIKSFIEYRLRKF
jgi:hypothetical protein